MPPKGPQTLVETTLLGSVTNQTNQSHDSQNENTDWGLYYQVGPVLDRDMFHDMGHRK
jgi:hypothetical protein